MKQMETKHIPKGTLLSPIKLAIFEYLREHGPATRKQVQAALAGRGFQSKFVGEYVYDMKSSGHLERFKPDFGDELFFHVPGDTRTPVVEPPPPPPVKCSIAGPRRDSVFAAPALTGGGGGPAREGALDAAAIPSLMFGRRVLRRAGRVAP
jgi:hypothetical protein